ncbi:hypothetical protein BK120_34005 [Paenibacillus sp. FSL A5-0031]|uniref:NHLP leader peptide family RiPP precursor n=1 Tax=Paenibacillus sp. FSL A5-0031 TaxID=1920420 RepID=UPI00096D22B0|nr:NHLP leader peptide family RiPP precursor [Paenibacillus sp. FSL A5-0031]OME68762.1 hypothetical protein BK120_34005 [Paenibacillus sp. FSL A5-0031]
MSSDLSVKEQIISKALEDDIFKKELMANPKAAMRKSFGIEFPENIKVDVLGETTRKFYLLIPPKPSVMKANEPKLGAMWQ